MASAVGQLSPAKVQQKTLRPGMYGDGGGLWLHVGPTGGKSWIFRYMRHGKPRETGLGPLHTTGLAKARGRALACRRQLPDGTDPLDARNAERAARHREAAKAITFEKCAEKYIASNRAGWRNQKHAAQWTSTLAAYAFPAIGKLPVGEIDTGHVTRILEPIWMTKAETASRVRDPIEAILDYAKTHGWRDGENPARWKGQLENVLPMKARWRG